MRPRGEGACLEIRRSRVEGSLRPLVEVEPDSANWFASGQLGLLTVVILFR